MKWAVPRHIADESYLGASLDPGLRQLYLRIVH